MAGLTDRIAAEKKKAALPHFMPIFEANLKL
jgi:hypothetical protein